MPLCYNIKMLCTYPACKNKLLCKDLCSESQKRRTASTHAETINSPGLFLTPAQFLQSALKSFAEFWRQESVYVLQSQVTGVLAHYFMDAEKCLPALFRSSMFRVHEQIRLRSDPNKRGHLRFAVFLC